MYRQSFESEFASRENFMLKPCMMLCPGGV